MLLTFFSEKRRLSTTKDKKKLNKPKSNFLQNIVDHSKIRFSKFLYLLITNQFPLLLKLKEGEATF